MGDIIFTKAQKKIVCLSFPRALLLELDLARSSTWNPFFFPLRRVTF